MDLVGRHHHLILRSDGNRELFDLHSDPTETRNLAGDPNVAGIERNLVRRTEELRARTLTVSVQDRRFKGLGYLP